MKTKTAALIRKTILETREYHRNWSGITMFMKDIKPLPEPSMFNIKWLTHERTYRKCEENYS